MWRFSGRWALVAALLVAGSGARAQTPAQDLDRAAGAVVALRTESGERSLFGAGVVIGRSADALLAITAAHVVATGSGGERISARLKRYPELALPTVTVLKLDRAADLALIRIGGLAAARIDACQVPRMRLDDSMPVQREHAVFPVGNPLGTPWQVPPSPDRVSEVGPREIRFQSGVIESGHSGGALFNVFGDFVALIRADQPPFGVALRPAVLLKALADWNVALPADPCGEAQRPAASPSASATTPFRKWAADASSSRAAFIAAVQALEYRSPSATLLAIYDNDLPALERAGLQADGSRLAPLQWAVILGRKDVLRYLLLKGVSLNREDQLRLPSTRSDAGEDAASALHSAARLDDAETVRLLARAGADLENGAGRTDGPGTPLTTAAAHGAPKAAQALIAAGADLNVTKYGWDRSPFPLLAALQAGDLPMAQLLRKAGAALKTNVGTSSDPSLLLGRVAESGPVASVRWLIEQRVPLECSTPICDSPLRRAVADNRVDVMNVLLKAGANATGGDFEPYLCLAVTLGHQEALKALLIAGANPNQRGRDGTPLQLARRDEKKPMVDALIAYGAKR